MTIFNIHQQKRVHYKNYLLLLLICLLAYWPLTFGIFSVKNDAIHYFLPYRFNISEALRNGEFPFWSPYIYLGNPIMGDMQSGAWNPIVWLFSAIGRYDITLFHYENLLYIFLGGVGMYKLTNRLTDHSHTALLIAVSYMLSGFMLGGQLINWLSAAAFLPFVIHYYRLSLHSPSVINAIKTGTVLFLLFTSSYPSFFILTAYLLVIFAITTFFQRLRLRNSIPFNIGQWLCVQLLIVLVFAGLSLPALVSYIDLLPYYQRGAGLGYEEAMTNALAPLHFSTAVFPATVKANDIISATDVTCRNTYIGIFPLLLLVALPPALNSRNIKLIVLAAVSVLFSLGDLTPFQKLCYNFVPLLDTFRHPSQLRLFFILALLLLAAPGLKKLIDNTITGKETIRLKRTAWAFIAGIMVSIILAISLKTNQVHTSLRFNADNFRTILKTFIESVSFADGILLSGSIQLLFLVLLIWVVKKKSTFLSFFSAMWIINLIVMAQLVLPASFVSKVSPAAINRIIHSSPKGFPADSLQKSLQQNSSDAFAVFNTIGLSYFYNKKIGISRITNSPAFLLQQDSFTKNPLLYNYVSSQPIAYIADSVLHLKNSSPVDSSGKCKFAFVDGLSFSGSCTENNTAAVKNISANSFLIETQTMVPAFLVLSQNYYHHWSVSIDGLPGKIVKTNLSFMGTMVPQGKHTVLFKFIPANTIKALWLQLTVICILLITLIILGYRSIKNKV